MRFTFFIIIFSLCFSAKANFDFNEKCKIAYEKILNLEFIEAEKIISAEKISHPSNKIPLLLDNYVDFLTLIIGEEKQEFLKRKQGKQDRLSAMENESKSSPWLLYSKAEINLQWAFTRIKFNEYITAAFEINKAYSLLKENENKFPDFVPNKKSIGLLHALVGTIPNEYRWAVNLMGFEGTIKQGISELEEAIEQSQATDEYGFLETENLFLLSFVQTNLNDDETEMKKLLLKIETKKSTSPLLVLASANLALHLGQNDKANFIFENYKPKRYDFPFYYLDYLHGMALLHQLDKSAKFYFENYLQQFRGINYMKSAYQKLAWCYLLNNDTAAAKKCFSQIKAVGNAAVDEDKQAMTEAVDKVFPNMILLKARLLFDGGYYSRALNILIESKPSGFLKTKRERLEYIYRLARIHQKTGNTTKAISYYEIVLKEGERFPYYFAANASLQLGLIYEGEKDFAKAKKYFEKTLSLKNHEYQSSIDQKTKAGLNRIAKN